MNKREACEWVHEQLIVAEMPFDDLVAAFTALVGHAPDGPDHRHGLFRRCYEVVTLLSETQRHATTSIRIRRPFPN